MGVSEDAVAGCRMTGGGFGGSCVALFREDSTDTATHHVGEAFSSRFSRRPTAFVTSAAGGARIIQH